MMKKRNRGQVLVLVALAIFVLMGLAALGIDVGYMYSVRHELQRCADAGALAGASAFKELGGGSDDSTIRSEADLRARIFASKDKVISSTLDPASEVSTKFTAEDSSLGLYQIRVETSREAPLFFGRIFRESMPISAFAVAEAVTASNKVNCLKPWGISYPWIDNNLDGIYNNNEVLHKDCPNPTPDNTDWYFCPGSLIQIKVSNGSPNENPSPQTEPSHFFALDFAELTKKMEECKGPGGAAGYETWISTKCLDDCLKVDVWDPVTKPKTAVVPLEPGNMVGPTIDGAQYLINQELIELGGATTFDPSVCDHPVFAGEDCSGTTWKSSPRVFRIPVYDPSLDQLSPGNDDIHVAEFAGMWIDHVDPVNNGQGTVYGRYIKGDLVSGEGGGAPTGKPELLYLRLVK